MKQRIKIDNSEDRTYWRRSPRGKIMPSDTVIAKNYLDKKELEHLNRIGNMYLDYAEMQAKLAMKSLKNLQKASFKWLKEHS